MELSGYLVIMVGIAVRLLLFDTDVSRWLAERNEISTPITSWKRLTEGITLVKAGVSPYSGDVYHEMPLTLEFWNRIQKFLGSSIKYAFITTDVVTGIILYAIATHFASYILKKQAAEAGSYHMSSKKLIIRAEDMKISRLYVLMVYLLNPLTIVSCIAKSTGILNNLAIILSFYFSIKNNRLGVCIFTGIASYLSLYPIGLIVPFALLIAHHESKEVGATRFFFLSSFFQTVICCLSFFGFLIYGSFLMEGNWDFLRSTMCFILGAPDHTPNIGIFWYFFTELFDHFKLFFLCVFQIHIFLYVLPLSCRLIDEPFFAAYLFLAFVCIFKSYPSYGDVSIWGSMVFLWRHTFQYMRNSFPSLIAIIVSVVLGPVLWHLWMFAGSANANFYFATSLVLTLAQVFIIFDLLFAYQRRGFELKVGTNQMGTDGKQIRYFLE